MQLHKLVIFAMLLALLSVLAVPTLSFARDGASDQYTLEPLDGHGASMRDMAGPGLQFLTSKNKSANKFITAGGSAVSQAWISEVRREAALPQKAKIFKQANQACPLWLINRALLI